QTRAPVILIQARGIEIDIVGNKPSLARLLHPLLDNRMACGQSLYHRRFVYDWPDIPPSRCQVRKVGQQISLRHSRRRMLDARRRLKDGSPQFGEDSLFNLDAPLMS